MAFSTEIGAFGASHSASLLFTSDQADEIAAAINKLILLSGGGSVPKYTVKQLSHIHSKVAFTIALYNHSL